MESDYGDHDEDPMRRSIELRAERDGDNRRYLSASVDDEGNLVIEGQDLGPATEPVSPDGEYEWIRTIAAKDIPHLLQLLDSPPDSDVLHVLHERWTGANSHELERRIRESDLESKLSVWS